jgi:hypothetical protein
VQMGKIRQKNNFKSGLVGKAEIIKLLYSIYVFS